MLETETLSESIAPDTWPLFVTCGRGLESILVDELISFGATEVKAGNGGVSARADREAAYRTCLWSRLASRVLMPLAGGTVADPEALYALARSVDWPELFDVSKRFAIEAAGTSSTVTHSHYAALKVKDAVVDAFRDLLGSRPDVARDDPDIRIHLHLHRDKATLSLDLSGDSLHRRGYRQQAGEAPLKETLAAAMLMRAGWATSAAEGAPLWDPFCGSGTLVIEAAMIAADAAPQRTRQRFGFEAWNDHVPALLKRLRAEADERFTEGLKNLPPLIGSDTDRRVLQIAQTNAAKAGFFAQIRWIEQDALTAAPPCPAPGLLICNPPYGERLGSEGDIIKLYSLLGARWPKAIAGWQVALLTQRDDLTPRLGLRATRIHSLYNGALPCKLLQFDIGGPAARAAASEPVAVPDADTENTDAAETPASPWARAAKSAEARESAAQPIPTVAEIAKDGFGSDFANRLQKNAKHLAKWAKRRGVQNYRVYDADLTEYAVAIDVYATPERQIHLQEYAPPKSIDTVQAEKRLRAALAYTCEVLDVPPDRLHFKVRRAQKGTAQYQRMGHQGTATRIVEHDVLLEVNFTDYLDTGVFLDHRPMRLRIQKAAAGKRFLNLFCYTGAATAHAAVGGAVSSVSVDLSNTYLEWAERNLRLNGSKLVDPERRASADNPHRLFRADCLAWLEEQAAKGRPPQFDLIFCDPPTFSNSKKMEDTLDIQRDHVGLLTHTFRLLAPGGVLLFSTNRRKFELDEAALAALGMQVRDITAETLDEDFKRPPPAHRAYEITHA
ncbi:bifunctional 23S rRNA (guanine(2069)-N(7))-methyltransferase RlmK/23S rRNA (guanine(2445)-N(2))-methyltransferase RlmL [Polycyclovorans algicola]|uniref:bifunctional 23S rRNA (guanine(2069)-N(7))-methyltransferase RlmK/23S rRNA (guanine(2445)-N(2))-methyltransferase RlmL n=1 Tax=Polycyclovorans algicola TaxID=616992 RepID=UPI00069467D5|nr:bifunctional 23S rRNA (guanine(2069)-N(7))-methyltransferase RlmK/23S rRNA (guanine(2445)-N(2))-methyltransferase RlmL [Polycyclovorans algicola]